jgi:hypothetical protein
LARRFRPSLVVNFSDLGFGTRTHRAAETKIRWAAELGMSMSAADQVRGMFPGRHFGAPCPESDIARAEAALGETLPAVLRDLYLAFDGFRGPTDAAFFWPLLGREGFVGMNQFFRAKPVFPQELMSRWLFFGDNGCGAQWALSRDVPDTVIQWEASWGSEFEVVGRNPVEVWRLEKQLYIEADE